MKYFSNKVLDKKIKEEGGGGGETYTADEETLHLGDGNEFSISDSWKGKINLGVTAYGKIYFQPNANLSSLVEPIAAFDYLGSKKGLIFESVAESEVESSPAHLMLRNFGTVENPNYALYTPYAIISKGDQIVGDGTPGGGGGGGGAGYLYELHDVADSLATPTSGMVLQYNGTEWVGVQASTIGGVTSVVGQTGAITAAQISAALNLGAAATYGIGSVASGNTGLVTGGSVYSAINSALSSVLKFVGVTTTEITDGSTTNPVIINGSSYTAVTGNVVLYGAKEYLWTGSAWEEMGDEASWALKTITIIAGTGLTGGGTLEANRTISLSSATIASLALADSAYQKPAGGIPNSDLANSWVKVGTTQINLGGQQTSLAGLVNVTMSGKLTIGSAEIEWVAGTGGAPGYLKINSALLTDGDQIVGSGTPGGGGGGGAGYLYELGDVYSVNNAVARADGTEKNVGDVLQYLDSTKGWVAVAASSIGRIYSAGTGLSISNSNVIGIATGYKLPTTTEWGNKADASALGDYVAKSGDVMTGDLQLKNSSLKFLDSNGDVAGWLTWGGSDKQPKWYDTSGSTAAWETIYHSGNFIAGTNYVSISGDESITGKKTFSLQKWSVSGNESNQIEDKGWGNGTYYKTDDSAVLGTNYSIRHALRFRWYGEYYDIGAIRDGSTGTIGFGIGKENSGNSHILDLFRVSTSGAWVIGNTVYHSGNFVAGTNFVAPATTLAGYGVTDWKVTSTSTALDSLTTSGVYRLGTQTTPYSSYGNLLVIHGGGDTLAQVYFPYNADMVFFRRGTTGNFASNAWQQLYHTGNANKSDVAWACSHLTATTYTMFRTTDNTANAGYVGRGSSIRNDIQLLAYAGNKLELGANNVTTITIDTESNVGIGTASPGYKLDVNGTIGITSTGPAINSTTATGVWNYIRLVNANTSTNYWDIATINTTSTFIGQANAFEIRDGLSSYSGISIRHNTSSYGKLVVTVPSGECSIGYWSTRANPRSGFPIWIAGYTDDTNRTFGWYYCGGTASGTYGWRMNLYPNGTLVTTGDQVMSSDATLKTNLKDITLTSEQIANAPAVSFDWKDGHGHSFGSIAQYWKPIVPEAVLGEEGNYTLAYGQLGAVLGINNGKAIFKLEQHETEQDKEIKRLKARVRELEKQLKMRS